MNKKEIIQAIKTFKKALKKGSPKTVWEIQLLGHSQKAIYC